MPIRPGLAKDLPACIAMLEAMRAQYQVFEPQFWKLAENARPMTQAFLNHLTGQDSTLFLVAEEGDTIKGFVMARPQHAPPVFAPGPTAFIDDFCVASPNDWATIGRALLREARTQLKARGFAQIIAVTAYRDDEKMAALKDEGLSLASAWFVASTG